MNEKKICFITAVNNDLIYNECIEYVKNLIIPNGFEIDFINIRNANSLCSAYNEAMKKSDAKYKVYLHQDVFIINKNFISNILSIFNNKSIGMIGMCGAKELSSNAIWWESSKLFGKVYEIRNKDINLISFKSISNTHEKVDCIDGLIMITQYDIPWRDDLFDGWHFYDISQCMEFKNKGYSIVVANQSIPWCIHDCGIVSTDKYDLYKNKFIQTYGL